MAGSRPDVARTGHEPPNILIVDDDARLRELLRRYLGDNGFRVTTAADGGQAWGQMASIAFDLVVLDVMMPGESGLSLTERVRGMSPVPILLLTAMGEARDRIHGLEIGADDYMAKPFEPRELVARIRSILRRVSAAAPAAALRLGPHTFDARRGELAGPHGRIHLTSAEARLLEALARQPGRPIARADLTRLAGLGGNERDVDVQVARLRRKIEADPRAPRFLQTVRGEGYVLHPDQPWT